jgi:hypothetical protein
MNMRHNELFLDNNNEFIVRSKDFIGRYSMWLDHSDVRFSEIYGKKNFEFKPQKILFLVPLLKKDLFFLRTENSKGIISEQFMYCSVSVSEKIQKKNFWKWLAISIIYYIPRSVSCWYLLSAQLFQFQILSLYSLGIAPALYFLLNKTHRSYGIKKINLAEAIYWIILSSSFYCLARF